MRHQRVVVCVLIALLTSVSSVAVAQDMVFTVEETGQPPAPPAEGPPSEALANALRLYQQERWMESAVQFQRVVEGETQDAPANVQKAQFFLGKALYHLRFYQSALAIFDEITQQGQGHNYFGQTLQWLAQLATQLPEPAGIIEKVGRYGADQLEQFNTAESSGRSPRSTRERNCSFSISSMRSSDTGPAAPPLPPQSTMARRLAMTPSWPVA